MKYCPGCETEKPLAEFGKHSRRGYQSYCKSCKREADRLSWHKNKKHLLLKRKERRRKISAVARELKNVPCPDCGVTYPYYVMDFDHVRGEKKFSLGHALKMVSSIEALLEETDKCEVVCANCHRERTYGPKSP